MDKREEEFSLAELDKMYDKAMEGKRQNRISQMVQVNTQENRQEREY